MIPTRKLAEMTTSPSDENHRVNLLGVSAFAERLGVSSYSVRKWVKSGQVRAIDLNAGGKLRVYRIPETEIDSIKEKIDINNDAEESGFTRKHDS